MKSIAALLPLLTKKKEEIDTFGRVPAVIAELVQDLCSNTYGVNNGTTSFCTATGAAGTECFNTFKTCQDPVNFRRSQKVVRFCKPLADMPASWGAIPSIEDVQMTPPRINAGGQSKSSGALGERGTGSIRLRDHPSSDLALDPYVATRPYDPLTRGTFWAKWLARNPYFQNRPLRMRFGYLGQAIEDMAPRYFVIDRIDGPDSQGMVNVHFVDVLRLAGDDKAQWPPASKGVLQNAITAAAGTFTVTGTTIAVDYESPAGTVRVRGETMTYTGISEAGGVITFTGVARGTDGTAAAAHNANDTVQRCVRYTNATPVFVLQDIFTRGAKIDAGALDLAGWNAAAATWLEGYELTALLTEPVGVETLAAEVSEQVQLMLWVDERTAQVKMLVLRPPFASPRTLDESSHIIGGSQRFRLDPAQRVSQVWMWFNQVDPTKKLDDETNYRETRVRLDPDAEGPNEYGESKPRKIHSRWLKTGAQVNDIQQRILARFRDNPIVGSIEVDAKDRDVWTGQLVQIKSRLFNEFTGLDAVKRFQIVGAEEIEPGHRVRLDLQSYEFGGYKVPRYTVPTAPDYLAASAEEQATGAWYADAAGLLPDGSKAYSYQ